MIDFSQVKIGETFKANNATWVKLGSGYGKIVGQQKYLSFNPSKRVES